ncbi:electron transfer flavoprotein-ubiquinone oxidoreductase (plasmid) [Vibrio alfacsensis]|uniref:Electron transfer flavoprotein-ubiquinone oxidoreductase n=1 Tax=Vibrio alfacsensis TaxID=1074311 RepID=A0ABN5PKT5_9VIBR|nr:electron transfer flavoprotein-ubiquinone oxidoreductase [Vibrio alfacsensis]AXY03782.1 electron transfer flavoprotein-ubiquinone oxidoreductase [Vibrio alfacsensis]
MRESMEFDVVIVGAGPSGLASACRLMQLAQEAEKELSVCVVEKGAEVGAHILSGAIVEPRALDELFPNWKEDNAPLTCGVTQDQVMILRDEEKSISLPHFAIPKPMHNDGNYIVSLGNVCRWLARKAEAMGVEIFPGFSASEVLYHEDGTVKGIATGDMGVDKSGQPKAGFMMGMELHAKYTLFSEGVRGHLGKQIIEHFELNKACDPQHYGLGIKEQWEIPAEKHTPGLVVHGSGWPLGSEASGGFFLYHGDNNQVSVGLIVDLNYRNPYLNPYEEFQRLKHHPDIAAHLEGGKRLAYGARAISKGGLNSLPSMVFPGGMLIGCNAGTLNVAKIKGTHTAMKSGMLAAEAVFDACLSGQAMTEADFNDRFKASWLYDELYRSRNFGPALHKFGLWGGGSFNYLEQNVLGGNAPITLRDREYDHAKLQPAEKYEPIEYPKPDGVLSFDKNSSVFMSNTNHEEDQPCHLKLTDSDIAIKTNLSIFAEPAQRYCPAGVYEVVDGEQGKQLQINAQNCLHCKTCDIKDPSQNITWVSPEGGGGPSYQNM